MTSPFLRARPSTPPIFARIYVERLPITGITSIPPAKQRFPRHPFPLRPLKVITSPSFSRTTFQDPSAFPFTLNPRSAPAKTAAPSPLTSISGPRSVTSRAAAFSGFPSIVFPSLRAGRSIAPATGTPLDWYPQRPRSCTDVSMPVFLTISSIVISPPL